MTHRVEHLAEGVELHLGDSREIIARCPPEAVVVTDPPYGIDFAYDGYVDTRESLKGLISDVIVPVADRAKRSVILPGITQVFLYPEPDWIMGIDWNTTGSFGRYGYTQWMPVLIYGDDIKGFGNVNGGLLKSDRISLSGGGGVGFMRAEKIAHPCPKPENVMRRVIARLSEPHDVIVDPFMGSGTTGVSAVALGRAFFGVELNPSYFDEACRRIGEEVRRPRLFAEPAAKAVQEALAI